MTIIEIRKSEAKCPICLKQLGAEAYLCTITKTNGEKFRGLVCSTDCGYKLLAKHDIGDKAKLEKVVCV